MWINPYWVCCLSFLTFRNWCSYSRKSSCFAKFPLSVSCCFLLCCLRKLIRWSSFFCVTVFLVLVLMLLFDFLSASKFSCIRTNRCYSVVPVSIDSLFSPRLPYSGMFVFIKYSNISCSIVSWCLASMSFNFNFMRWICGERGYFCFVCD